MLISALHIHARRKIISTVLLCVRTVLRIITHFRDYWTLYFPKSMYPREHANVLIKHRGHLSADTCQFAYHASVYSFKVSVIQMYTYLNSVSMHIQVMCMNLLKKNRNNCSGNDFLSPPNSFPGRQLSFIRVI